MTIDLLTKFSYHGVHGHYLYWIGVMACTLFALYIVTKSVRYSLHLTVIKIAEFEIDRLQTILVPKYFNKDDFGLWLVSENLVLGRSPISLIFTGDAATTVRKLRDSIKNLTVPELYETILALPFPVGKSGEITK